MDNIKAFYATLTEADNNLEFLFEQDDDENITVKWRQIEYFNPSDNKIVYTGKYPIIKCYKKEIFPYLRTVNDFIPIFE